MALKKNELRNPKSCLNSARNDEPIFVLRANDELAAFIVEKWAAEYKASKEALGEFDEARQAKYAEALALANQMDAWRASRDAHQLPPEDLQFAQFAEALIVTDQHGIPQRVFVDGLEIGANNVVKADVQFRPAEITRLRLVISCRKVETATEPRE